MVCEAPPKPAKKKLIRRGTRDFSQPLRLATQCAFALLNIWIGVQFYLWVRYYETGGRGMRAARPAGVEGWLPIASLMNLKYWLETGVVPQVHPAGMFLLVSFVAMSFFVRKAFCSWVCPVGTLSEYLWKAGRSIFGRNWSLPRWADIPLRSLKYILLGLFLYAVGSLSPQGLREFMESPYGLVSDVKMLNFFRFLGVTAAVVLGVLAIASIFVQNFWCRFLCPYGALLGLVSALSPARIRRVEATCIDCAKCAQACPSLLPVDKLITIKTPECAGCLECVAVCPAENTLYLSVPSRRALPEWAVALAIAVIFLGIVGFAKSAGYWETPIPDQTYFDLIPRAQEFAHP